MHLLAAREEDKNGATERREILLHDLSDPAGERRELTALHLRETHAVLAVFDPALDADPGAAIRCGRCARGAGGAPAEARRGAGFFAVASRPLGGRGEDAAIASGRLDLSLLDLPLAGLLVAPKDSPRQLQRLREALLDALDEAPVAVPLESSGALSEVETLLREERRNGRQLTTAEDLFRFYLGRDQEALPEARALFDACLRQLELRGQLRRLRLGQLVTSPQLVEAYGRALLAKAAQDPRGGLLEDEALEGELEVPAAASPRPSSTGCCASPWWPS